MNTHILEEVGNLSQKVESPVSEDEDLRRQVPELQRNRAEQGLNIPANQISRFSGNDNSRINDKNRTNGNDRERSMKLRYLRTHIGQLSSRQVYMQE